jgi:hypothetical protein
LFSICLRSFSGGARLAIAGLANFTGLGKK